MPIKVSVPDAAVRAADLPHDELAQHLTLLLAVDLVRQQTLSPAEGAKLAKLSTEAFRSALNERGVTYHEETTPEQRDRQITRARKSMLDR